MIQDRLLDMIGNGAIKPNEKLASERELCSLFEVSRTSVREALNGLISIGILEKRSDGTYVRDNNNDIVKEPLSALLKTKWLTLEAVTEARIAIECQMVRIAAKKAQKEDIIKCQKILREIQKSKDPSLVIELKAKFHMQIALMTKNDIIIAAFSVLYDVLNSFRLPNGEKEKATVPLATHEQILNCIVKGDEDGAENMMRKHLESITDYEVTSVVAQRFPQGSI